MSYPLPGWARDRFVLETIELRGVRTPYLVGGSGEPVVMVHGLSGSLDWWQYNAPALAEHFRVFLIDLPGFGRLGHLSVCASMHDYVDWLREWMAGVGLNSAHIIGHSMGGHIGLRLAVEDPDMVRRLVLVAPAGVVPETEIPRYVVPLIKVLRNIPAALLPLAVRDLRRANLRTVWRSSQDLIEHHVLDILEKVQVPTLIVWGNEDPVLPFTLARQFQDAISGSELFAIPDAGHIAMVDSPEVFNDRAITFLSGESGM